MTDIERDHVLRRAVQTLRQVPAADAAAIRRVVEAAAAERVLPAADEPTDDAPVIAVGRGRWRLVGFSGLIAAAALIGFIVRGSVPRALPSAGAGASTVAVNSSASLRQAANGGQDQLPIAQQFVFRSTSAHRVAVIGDFNGWNSTASPMTRESGGDLWSVTIPIAPGRHTYGFMVDDSTFTLDPDTRVPRARDPDLGAEGSVVIVGRP
jgi:predicted carbohydrate-binding protein with CBM48